MELNHQCLPLGNRFTVCRNTTNRCRFPISASFFASRQSACTAAILLTVPNARRPHAPSGNFCGKAFAWYLFYTTATPRPLPFLHLADRLLLRYGFSPYMDCIVLDRCAVNCTSTLALIRIGSPITPCLWHRIVSILTSKRLHFPPRNIVHFFHRRRQRYRFLGGITPL